MTTTKTVLIVGGTRGLGAALAQHYAKTEDWSVIGTARGATVDSTEFPQNVKWLCGVDLMKRTVGDDIVQKLKELGTGQLDLVVGKEIL
jgi:NAD(P)-dependent dehydrogenase (short-subunit alcohol dehydrogenase family)